MFGSSMTFADLNNDGYDELVIGASCGYGEADSCTSGAYIFDGANLSTEFEVNETMGYGPVEVFPEDADWVIEEDTSIANQVSSVANLGDINGDGVEDLGIGDRGFSGTNFSTPSAGGIHIYLGLSE